MLIKIIRFPFFIIFLFLMLLYNLITRKTFYDHIITSITEDFFALNNYDQISSRYTKQEIFFLATIDSIMRYNN